MKARIDERIARREAELAELRAENPQPKLWKQFATPKFGAGRNARFGDLDGDGMPEMLIAQNIPRIGDNFIQISCLTAVTFDGKVLWQLGRPDPRNGLLTADTPFQIHDIDGDGRNEVVMVKDFKLQVSRARRQGCGSRSGCRRLCPTIGKKPYTLDQRRRAGVPELLRAAGKRREILVKDRYSNFWIFDNRLERLWQARGRPAIIRIPFDIDGDGRDELAIGYAIWDHRRATALEPRRGAAGPRRRHRGRQLRCRSRRPSRGSMPGAATKGSSCSTAAARS